MQKIKSFFSKNSVGAVELLNITSVSVFVLLVTIIPLISFLVVPRNSNVPLTVIGVGLLMIISLLGILTKGNIMLPRKIFSVLFFGMIISIAISYFVASPHTVSLLGSSFESTTVLGMLGLLGILWFSFWMFLKNYISTILFGTISLFGFLATLAHTLYIIIGKPFFLKQIFGNQLSLIGTMFDAQWYAIITLVGLLVFMTFFPVRKWIQIMTVLFVLMTLFLLIATAHIQGIFVVGISTLVLILIIFSLQTQESTKKRTVPWLLLGLFFISVISLFIAQPVYRSLASVRPVTLTEIKPSFRASQQLIQNTLQEKPLFGYGPNQIAAVWDKVAPHRNADFRFTSIEINSSSSTFINFFIEFGIIGFLLLAFLILFPWIAIVQRIFKSGLHKSNDFTALVLTTFQLLFIIIHSITVPSYSISVLFMVSTGFLWASYYSVHHAKIIELFNDARKSFFAILLIIAGILVTAFVIVIVLRSVVAFSLFQKARANNESSLFARASSQSSVDTYRIAYAQVLINQLETIARQVTQENAPVLRGEFEQTLQQVLALHQSAVQYNPNNFRNWNSWAGTYGLLGTLGIQGSYDRALELYDEAGKRAPFNPLIPLAQAQISQRNNANVKALEYEKKSFDIRPTPNYYIYQFEKAQRANEIGKARQSLQSALLLTPRDAQILFLAADFEFNQKRYEQARQYLEIMLGLNYRSIETYGAYIKVLVTMGQQSLAQSLVDQLRTLNTDNATALANYLQQVINQTNTSAPSLSVQESEE